MLTILASLWWIVGLSTQSAYGLDILKFTETLATVSHASLPSEVLRGLGYWFFYGSDKIGPWIEPSVRYTQDLWLHRGELRAAAPRVRSLPALVRWRHRGVLRRASRSSASRWPSAPTPTTIRPCSGAPFKSFAESSSFGLALRSTGRAVPLVALGLAVLLGLGVNAVARGMVESAGVRGRRARGRGAR